MQRCLTCLSLSPHQASPTPAHSHSHSRSLSLSPSPPLPTTTTTTTRSSTVSSALKVTADSPTTWWRAGGVGSTAKRWCSSESNEPKDAEKEEELFTCNWLLRDGTSLVTKGKRGTTLLELAHKNDIELEGACEQSLACSTCHVVVEGDDWYDKLGEPEDEEYDMLDLAFGLTDTSRLGCQIVLNETTDGITVKIPSATRNMMVDGHVPKPH
eukprot:TRINITY_DN2512_c1_g1_i2.p1 TRINITY_DN2512_c1_g1~~TRINITY_DN2512_c1_g1_i2.p1  ORF type:complete len:212 (-),score=53.98 TRINITY_DN2512_c1_g1_i2:323-958(-)